MLSIAVLVLRYASYRYPSARPIVRGGEAGEWANEMGWSKCDLGHFGRAAAVLLLRWDQLLYD